MNADELKRAGAPVVPVPVALGGEAITYNLPVSIPGGLRLNREALADIFLGKISRWNDPVLEKLNPRSQLPNLPIVSVHRSDGVRYDVHLHRLPQQRREGLEGQGRHRQERAMAGEQHGWR